MKVSAFQITRSIGKARPQRLGAVTEAGAGSVIIAFHNVSVTLIREIVAASGMIVFLPPVNKMKLFNSF